MKSNKYPEISLENLVESCSVSEQRLRHAHALAEELYGQALTMADIPQIVHGRHVAKTVCELGLGDDAVLAGLLNHAEGDQALQRVETECGSEVAELIQGLRTLDIYTKNIKQRGERTLEAIRRALLALIEGDVRVVLIRLAMALHTLRAAVRLDAVRRDVITQDVLHIFAPLANRLGIWTLKWELEDKAFQYSEPEKYKAIANALAERREARDKRIEEAKRKLQEGIEGMGISAEISGRPKHIYSIHKKMERKGVSFDEIMDAHAVRVIIDRDEPEAEGLTEEERKQKKYMNCYRVLGFVHSIWKPIPTEFDDYIQNPKKNGYRSLHTAVYDDTGRVIEIQIRTRRMHEEAEQGFAAHWAYKEGSKPSAAMLRQVESLREALGADQLDEVAEDRHDRAERVFVFTRDDDVIDLPKGSTPIDFAYYIHTNVGHRTRGAKINNKMVPLTTKLQSGDRVEILTHGTRRDDIGKPSREWMNASAGYAFTGKARSRIRAWFREHERDKNIELGEQRLNRTLRDYKVYGKVSVEQIAAHFGDNREDFLVKFGFGDYRNAQIDGAIALIMREMKSTETAAQQPEETFDERQDLRKKQSKNSSGIHVMGMPGMHTTMARCCSPVFPEPIVGYVTRGRGVTIHRDQCNQIKSRQKTEADRIVEASWGNASNGHFQVPFRIKSYHSARLLETIAQALQGQNINLIKTKSTRQKYHTDVYLLTEVSDIKQEDWIKQKLSNMPSVFEVHSR